MIILLRAFKTHQTDDAGKVIYNGTDPLAIEPALAKAAKEGFIRCDKLTNPRGIPVALPEVAKPAGKAPSRAADDDEK